MLWSLIVIKVLIALIVFLLFFLAGRLFKGAILAVLLYMAIPTPEDMFVLPAMATWIKMPLVLAIVLYYGILWLLIYLILKFA